MTKKDFIECLNNAANDEVLLDGLYGTCRAITVNLLGYEDYDSLVLEKFDRFCKINGFPVNGELYYLGESSESNVGLRVSMIQEFRDYMISTKEYKQL